MKVSGEQAVAERAEALEALLVRVAVPLLTIDRAQLYIVAVSDSLVHLHLGGAYAGCPGAPFVEAHLLKPLVAQVLPRATLKMTTAHPVPRQARLLVAPGD